MATASRSAGKTCTLLLLGILLVLFAELPSQSEGALSWRLGESGTKYQLTELSSGTVMLQVDSSDGSAATHLGTLSVAHYAHDTNPTTSVLAGSFTANWQPLSYSLDPVTNQMAISGAFHSTPTGCSTSTGALAIQVTLPEGFEHHMGTGVHVPGAISGVTYDPPNNVGNEILTADSGITDLQLWVYFDSDVTNGECIIQFTAHVW